MRAWLPLVLAALASAPACAAVLGLDDVGYGVGDAGTSLDGTALEASTDASTDATDAGEGGAEAAADASVRFHCDATACVLLSIDGGGPQGIALDPEGVLYVAFQNVNQVWKVAIDGTGAAPVAHVSQPLETAAGHDYVAWATVSQAYYAPKSDASSPSFLPASDARQLAIVGGTLYFADRLSGSFHAVDLASGADSVVPSGINPVQGLAIDRASGDVYLSSYGLTGDILRMKPDGGAQAKVSAEKPLLLAVDSQSVYAIADSDAAVVKAPLAFNTGTNLVTINTSIRNPHGIAADATGIYVVDGNDNDKVWHVPLGGGAQNGILFPCQGPQRIVAGFGGVFVTCGNSGTVVGVPTQ